MCLLDVSGLECGPLVSPCKCSKETHKKPNSQVRENYTLHEKVCATWGW
jgi:hypothetical protein